MNALQFYLKYYLFRSTRKVENIERVIKSHGFRIYPFRPEATNDLTTKLIGQLGATEYANHHICFVLSDGILKGVFIKKGLSDDDRIYLLFHEEAHIWYNHLNITGFNDQTDTQQEAKANNLLLKVRFFKAVTLFLLIAATITAVCLIGGIH